MSWNPTPKERFWQDRWEAAGAHIIPSDENRPKFYCLEMFPYPSGKMHMGHVRNYSIGDAVARFKRLMGYRVLYPMGFDSFGMPAENAAKEVGGHPREITEQNIVTITEQLQRMGFSYDWDREVRTHTPEYYRWNQWLFLELDKAGLIERRMATVNWDPVEQSVLANEQVIDGRGWRSGALVEQREIPQWFLRITAYADELLSDLESIDFPENVATMQENWIGRSEGADIHFEVSGTKHTVEVFTTRPDTIFGVTFLTLAPTHPLAEELVNETEYEPRWRELVNRVNNMTEHEIGASKDKHGVFLGRYAIHPFTNEMIPIWAGDFVLASYGTGAVMGVPAHDDRDFAFAKAHNIAIKEVLLPSKDHQSTTLEEAYTGEGWMVNSGLDGFDGLYGDEARSTVIESLEERKKGVRQIQWRLRDWLISRQRYWGTPIPILYDEDGEPHHVPQNELPVELPDDVTFDHEGGGNPINRSPTFTEVSQSDGSQWRRETDTMDTFFCSSWYFLRFTDPVNTDLPYGKDSVDQWLPVDLYIGGIEHAILHLLYARFITKALRDIGLHAVDEPFQNLLCQGMVTHQTYQGEDGRWLFPEEVDISDVDNPKHVESQESVTLGRIEKMSKSKKNVVDPESILDTFGADTLRLFMLFAAQPEAEMDWSQSGVEAAWRQIQHIHSIPDRLQSWKDLENPIDAWLASVIRRRSSAWAEAMENCDLRRAVEISHYDVIKDVMWYQRRGGNNRSAGQQFLEQWIPMLAPATPHLAEEMWSWLGNDDLLAMTTMTITDSEDEDERYLLTEVYLQLVLDQARHVKRLAERKGSTPMTSLVFQTSSDLPKHLTRFAIEYESKGGDLRGAMGEVMRLPETQDDGVRKQVPQIWKKIVDRHYKRTPEERRMIVIDLDEQAVLSQNAEFIAQELGLLEVSCWKAGDGEDVGGKAAVAAPLQPALAFRTTS